MTDGEIELVFDWLDLYNAWAVFDLVWFVFELVFSSVDVSSLVVFVCVLVEISTLVLLTRLGVESRLRVGLSQPGS